MAGELRASWPGADFEEVGAAGTDLFVSLRVREDGSSAA